jgi:hypothetical protein
VFRWIHHEDNEEEKEEEERFVRLERRLVLNVEFDDALSKCWSSTRIIIKS